MRERKLGAIFTCLLLLPVASVGEQQTQSDLATQIAAAFENDPVQALKDTTALFGKARRRKEVGTMEVIFSAMRQATSASSLGALTANAREDVVDVLIADADRRGQWAKLGDYYAFKSGLAYHYGGGDDLFSAFPRRIYFAGLSEAAYRRAGVDGATARKAMDRVELAFRQYTRNKLDHLQDHPSLKALRDKVGPNEFEALWRHAAEAKRTGRDGDAIGLVRQLLSNVDRWTTRDAGPTVMGVYLEVAPQFLHLRGSEALIPAMEALCNTYEPALERLGHSLAYAADYKLDEAFAAFGVRYYDYIRRRGKLGEAVETAIHLMGRGNTLKRETFAQTWAARAEEALALLPANGRPGHVVHYVLSVEKRPAPRAWLMGEYVRARVREGLYTEAAWALEGIRGLPWDKLPIAADPMACALLQAVPTLDPKDSSVLLAAFARGLDKAGLSQQAAAARQYAAAVSTQSPQAYAACFLALAKPLAERGEWSAIEQALDPVVARLKAAGGGAPSADTIGVILLLASAKQATFKRREIPALLAFAAPMVGRVPDEMPTDTIQTWLLMAGLADTATRPRYLRSAYDVAAKTGLDFLMSSILQRLSDSYLRLGNRAEAKKCLAALVALQERSRQQLAFNPALRAEWFGQRLEPYRGLMDLACKDGDAGLALQCGECMRARTLLESVQDNSLDVARKLPPRYRTEIRRVRERRTQVYAAIQDLMRGGSGGEGDGRGSYIPVRGVYLPIRGGGQARRSGASSAGRRVSLEQLSAELEGLTRYERQLGARLREEVPGYAEAMQTRMPTATEVVQALAEHPGMAALEYTLVEGGVVAVAVSAKGAVTVRRIAVTDERLRKLVEAGRRALVDHTGGRTKPLAELHELLVAPVASQIGSARALLIVADGALQLVPFGAFRTPEEQYLIEKLPLEYAPSLTTFLAKRRKLLGQKGVLAAGDPIFDAADLAGPNSRGTYLPVRGTYVPVRGPAPAKPTPVDGPSFDARLPGTAVEVQRITECVPNSLALTREQATKSAVQSRASDYRALHFATHGFADADRPDFSRLLLSREGEGSGVLLASEVYGWRLRAELVGLSACQTGLGKEVRGEGILGLSRAFLVAGAHSVLCSLWKVPDESTAHLMVKFYEGWQAGKPKREALRDAQLELLHAPSTAAPCHWAAFILVTGPHFG